jgi:hypothetical protein
MGQTKKFLMNSEHGTVRTLHWTEGKKHQTLMWDGNDAVHDDVKRTYVPDQEPHHVIHGNLTHVPHPDNPDGAILAGFSHFSADLNEPTHKFIKNNFEHDSSFPRNTEWSLTKHNMDSKYWTGM